MRTHELNRLRRGLWVAGLLIGLGLSGCSDLPPACVDEDANGVCDSPTPAGCTSSAETLEVCDGADNNCNGQVDEGVLESLYLDSDADGFGTGEASLLCAPQTGYAAEAGDCNDTDAAIHPEAEEVCDGIDNNCDGTADEDLISLYYQDVDDDGYGKSTVTTQACEAPDGYSSQGGDCNDGSATTYPGAPELCDGVDNNCNGQVDDGVQEITWYRDSDRDGYGDPTQSQSDCRQPQGYVQWTGDCNDTDAAIHPGAEEVCDGVDNNCDGTPDEDLTSLYYQDTDKDGYGKSTVTTQACVAPTGYSSQGGDCDDTNSAIHPGASELPGDGVDQSCDGQELCYLDADGDGHRPPTGTTSSTDLDCTDAGEASGTLPATDCNDQASGIHPGAEEVCDGVDNNCDGSTDSTCWDAARWDSGVWGP